MSSPRRTLITGSTRGIGLAIAERLARTFDVVILNYAHDQAQAADAADRLRGSRASVQLLRADVTDEAQVSRLVADATSDGPIDLWVNNVGEFLYKSYEEVTAEEWRGILDSNLTSAFLCCREILPSMRDVGRGSIVNIASMNAETLRPAPNTLPYAIANLGIVALTKTLAKSEGHRGIRVNAVSPGFVESGDHPPKDLRATVPIGRLVRPDEIAAAVAFLASDEAAAITGAVLDVHGGALL